MEFYAVVAEEFRSEGVGVFAEAAEEKEALDTGCGCVGVDMFEIFVVMGDEELARGKD